MSASDSTDIIFHWYSWTAEDLILQYWIQRLFWDLLSVKTYHLPWSGTKEKGSMKLPLCFSKTGTDNKPFSCLSTKGLIDSDAMPYTETSSLSTKQVSWLTDHRFISLLTHGAMGLTKYRSPNTVTGSFRILTWFPLVLSLSRVRFNNTCLSYHILNCNSTGS